jgi:hypothetical protein
MRLGCKAVWPDDAPQPDLRGVDLLHVAWQLSKIGWRSDRTAQLINVQWHSLSCSVDHSGDAMLVRFVVSAIPIVGFRPTSRSK